ncbi:LysR family transcriptional regulator [Chitinophaga nivalis]|uniref:LysR family transcriptional regulator n=1 Tax=Chitinophaga nivalis TaxID=2991709 RepID=A0ABT3IGK1_9BACT|nr:LysR family transcriptional regulator [Chitinophaga nivalis]MCW3467233.1 LysR family transcriptional regulator [Chitinophaga nivalis]MCW3483075.1 LysR family transcriptional regulator [Chitinophaga nivalis]
MIHALLDLELLRTFVLAAELDSFAKAAEQVNRSQSAVSLQIQRLEEMTGQPLFVKQGRGRRLTAAGEMLLGYARQLLDINHKAVTALTATHIAGKVKLGLLADFADSGLPTVLARFAAIHPQVEITIVIDRQGVLQQQLQAGKLDVITVFSSDLPAAAIPIGQLPMRWIGGETPAIAQQSPLPLLLFEAPCLFRTTGLAALDKVSHAWRPALTSANITGMWAAAKAGLGITVRTALGLPDGCKIISTGLPPLPEVHVLLQTQAAAPAPAVQRLTHILEETIAEQIKNIKGGKITRRV